MEAKKYELPVLLDLCGGSPQAVRAVLPLCVLKDDGLWLDREAIAVHLALPGDRHLVSGPSPDIKLIDALWRRAEEAGLTWLPSKNSGVPALPVPFSARELAAFMLAGGGLALFERFDDAPLHTEGLLPPREPDEEQGHFRISKDAVLQAMSERRSSGGPANLDDNADEAREVLREALRLRYEADAEFGREDEGVRKSASWLLRDAHGELTADSPPTLASTEPDKSLLATPAQLIAAFGPFTDMDETWFDNLKDAPALLNARRVKGRGQRGHSVAPLFCPMALMPWLMDPKRKKGRAFHSASKPWELLERHFPLVYAKYSAGDPRDG